MCVLQTTAHERWYLWNHGELFVPMTVVTNTEIGSIEHRFHLSRWNLITVLVPLIIHLFEHGDARQLSALVLECGCVVYFVLIFLWSRFYQDPNGLWRVARDWSESQLQHLLHQLQNKVHQVHLQAAQGIHSYVYYAITSRVALCRQ